jgi:predicted Holliday junction resolvase-like endonuclease
MKYVVHGIVGFLLLCVALMFGCPQWNVYSSRLSGEAQLAKAESNRKITVEEAEAKKLAATHLAEAEVIRAGGVAQAQEIINGTLTDRYIRWLQAESISEQECDVRYVPTEAQLPILEARTPKE